jgi:hypothetical protein
MKTLAALQSKTLHNPQVTEPQNSLLQKAQYISVAANENPSLSFEEIIDTESAVTYAELRSAC